jgi:hypothetical protein
MSGAYTHITLENEMKEPMRLEAIPGFPEDAIISVLDYFKFCELGAVSPDYPYLALDDPGAAVWADQMHYTRTGEMIHAGIRHLREMEGEAQQKGLAWLLGYAAHVATDVTIHPVVEKKVGPYHENQSGHRICEMNQDVYIFQRLNLGDIGLSDHLDSGIARCGDPDDPDQLDPDVTNLWQNMLQDVYPDEFESNPPDIHKWHRRFKLVVGEIASSGNVLLPLARHVASGMGLVYPLADEVDMQYIEDLETPEGTIHFDDLFDKAVQGVEYVWGLVASGVLAGDDEYLEKIGNWNLDTGRDEDDQLVFWEE